MPSARLGGFTDPMRSAVHPAGFGSSPDRNARQSDAICSNRRSMSTGLSMTAIGSRGRSRRFVASDPSAVMTMIGTRLEASRMAVISSNPSIPGIARSVMTKSIDSEQRISNATLPLSHCTTSTGRSESPMPSATLCRNAASSSTRSTVARRFPFTP